MHHGLELAPVEPTHELTRRHEIGDLPGGEIAPFACTAEEVIDGDIGAPGFIEARDDVRSDKTGRAGDQ